MEGTIRKRWRLDVGISKRLPFMCLAGSSNAFYAAVSFDYSAFFLSEQDHNCIACI